MVVCMHSWHAPACWRISTYICLIHLRKKYVDVMFRCDWRLHIWQLDGPSGHAHVYTCHIIWGQFYQLYLYILSYDFTIMRSHSIYIHNCRSFETSHGCRQYCSRGDCQISKRDHICHNQSHHTKSSRDPKIILFFGSFFLAHFRFLGSKLPQLNVCLDTSMKFWIDGYNVSRVFL